MTDKPTSDENGADTDETAVPADNGATARRPSPSAQAASRARRIGGRPAPGPSPTKKDSPVKPNSTTKSVTKEQKVVDDTPSTRRGGMRAARAAATQRAAEADRSTTIVANPPARPRTGDAKIAASATMGSRLVARILDGLVVGVTIGLIGIISGIIAFASLDGPGALIVALAVYFVVGVIGPVLYEVGLVGTQGATLGKRWMGIKVVDVASGRPIGIGRAFARYLVLGITGAIIVGYFSPYFDKSGRLRGWHDKAARDVVVQGVPERPDQMRWLPAGVLGVAALVLAVRCIALGSGVWYHIKSSDEVRGEVLAAAKTCTGKVSSYDYRTLGEAKKDGLSCATGQFKKDYAMAMDTIIAKEAPVTKTTQSVQVAKAGIEQVSSDGKQWTVLIYGQHTVTNIKTGLKTPRLDKLSVRATMDKVGNKWLISKIDLIPG